MQQRAQSSKYQNDSLSLYQLACLSVKQAWLIVSNFQAPAPDRVHPRAERRAARAPLPAGAAADRAPTFLVSPRKGD
jgi:hypothetical protein